jgi:hypothetical protein
MKGIKVVSGKTYIGIVEDNIDPDKLGRIKIRVLDVFDEAKIEEIPFATPWKDLGGSQISIPEKGKVVMVVFEQGDPYKPEYISTEHWNVNLENKLKSLSDSDYLSMKSLIFDHKTQIYSNDTEGLKLDHKWNNINIKSNGINLNLKDNNMMLNIGDESANQQAILGNHFLDWFDEFVTTLLSNTAFLGNLGGPILTNPALIRVLTKYQSLKDPMFLSHHVNIVDNNKVTSVKIEPRQETAQNGDVWTSTKTQNTVTTTTNETNKPTTGDKQQYDEKHTEPSTEIPGVRPEVVVTPKNLPKPTGDSLGTNKKVEKIIWFLKSKNYKIFEKTMELNLVAFRNKKNVKDEEISNVTNKFDESLAVFYKDEKNEWQLIEYSITTVPGLVPQSKNLPNKVAILRSGQYYEVIRLGNYLGNENYKCLIFDSCEIHRNDKIDRYNFNSPSERGNFAITIHASSEISSSEYIFNYSEGAQVFKNKNQYDQFIKLCQMQIETSKKTTFTYTLCDKSEFDQYPEPDKQREELSKITQTNPIVSNQEETPQTVAAEVVKIPISSGLSELGTKKDDLKLGVKLYKGLNGQEVSKLQQILNRINSDYYLGKYASVKETGLFDESTLKLLMSITNAKSIDLFVAYTILYGYSRELLNKGQGLDFSNTLKKELILLKPPYNIASNVTYLRKNPEERAAIEKRYQSSRPI